MWATYGFIGSHNFDQGRDGAHSKLALSLQDDAEIKIQNFIGCRSQLTTIFLARTLSSGFSLSATSPPELCNSSHSSSSMFMTIQI